MLRLQARVFSPLLRQSAARISNWKIPAFEIDSAGISGLLESRNEAYLTFSQKMSEIAPKSLYYGFDQWTRQLLVTLSTDLSCSFATSIIIATIFIKAIFLYPTMRGQLQGLRQPQMKALSDAYRERMKTAQMTRNKLLMTQASYQYKIGMKKKGFSTTIPMLNLFQIPILITWFLSLRYMSNLPEVYPQMLSEGYFWFSDLSSYDPYFVLPVAAACITSLSISRSPNLSRNNMTLPLLAPYIKYLKYLPFASLAFTSFFPASINLYWFTLASFQLMITEMMHIRFFRNIFSGHHKTETNKKKSLNYEAAVFVSEKATSEDVIAGAAQKIEERKDQFVKDSISKGVNISVKDVKVSFNKIKKKKKNADDEATS